MMGAHLPQANGAKISRNFTQSFGFEASSLDNGPPLLNLRRVKCTERLGRLLVAIWDLKP
jgi:hypothetical protein